MTARTEPPFACSLSAEGQAQRVADFRDLAERALVDRERTEDAVVLRFCGGEEVKSAVRDLARREKECCPFFTFGFEERPDGLALSVSAPAEGQGLLESVFGEVG